MPLQVPDIKYYLDRIEPDYPGLAEHGRDALPALLELASSDDPRIATPAIYAAATLAERAAGDPAIMDTVKTVIEIAADSRDPLCRVAAAWATHTLPPDVATELSSRLMSDPDPGVRATALEAMPVALTPKLVARAEHIRDDETEDPRIRDMAAALLLDHPRTDS